MKNWKDRTCQDCAFNVDERCRFNPPVLAVDSYTNRPEWLQACSQYTYNFIPTFADTQIDSGEMIQRTITEDGQRAMIIRDDVLIAGIAYSVAENDHDNPIHTYDTEVVPPIDQKAASYLIAAFLKHFITKYRFSMEDVVDKVRDICLKGEWKTRRRK